MQDGAVQSVGVNGDRRLHVDVLGVHVSVTNLRDVCSQVERWLAKGSRAYVCVTGVHGVMESQDDPALREIHNRSGLTVPDGVPMVWAGRFAGARQIERVYGPRMMDAVCELAARNNWRTFLYGGSPDVVDRLRDRLERRYRDLEIVGSLSPPFRGLTPDEDSEVVETIRGLAPQIVWVGLSTPKQERWMAEHLHHMPSPCVMFGVGAAFDIHAGVRREAPEWVGRLGLQWLFRLAQEPRRLWRRYLMNNPRFVLEIVRRRPVIVNKREAASSETAGSLH